MNQRGVQKLRQKLRTVFIAAVVAVAPFSARSDGDSPAFQIQQIDPTFDSQKMAGPGFEVYSADELNRGEWKIPDTKTRDDIFYKSGLKKETESLDDMDKDVLFITARDGSAHSLVKNYPKLPKEKLLDLSKLAKGAPAP